LQSKLAVITDFTQRVLKPAYQKEKLQLSFKLLADHPQRLNENQESKLNALLDDSSTLHKGLHAQK
jgi:hypothetical protein